MSAVSYQPVEKQAEREIPLQEASLDIWRSKYCLQDSEGNAVDDSIDHSFQRVARALADVLRHAHAVGEPPPPPRVDPLHDALEEATR